MPDGKRHCAIVLTTDSQLSGCFRRAIATFGGQRWFVFNVVVVRPIVGDAQQEAEEQDHLRASAWYISPREPRRGSPLPVHLSWLRRGV